MNIHNVHEHTSTCIADTKHSILIRLTRWVYTTTCTLSRRILLRTLSADGLILNLNLLPV